jgi:hypothetical protein
MEAETRKVVYFRLSFRLLSKQRARRRARQASPEPTPIMTHLQRRLAMVLLLFAAAVPGNAQQDFTRIDLSSLDAFRPAAANWQLAGDLRVDRSMDRHLQALPGNGTLVNLPADGARDNLFTGMEHGDIELQLEFLMPKGSNSGVYLQGRYEIQLFDSWNVKKPGFDDVGGIYQRWDPTREGDQRGYEGHAPSMNVARAPGLWQQLHIIFQAPRFDAQGHKTANAKMVRVALNGVVLHEQVELTGPTRAAAFDDEKAMGPLMIQGDHGPVALRNIQYRAYEPPPPPETQPRFVPAIFLEPGNEPEVIRGFVEHDGVKKTRTIAVGDPQGVHYVFDSEQGALIKIWKGDFLETTDMWHSRGVAQLAVPRGAVIDLSGAPTVGLLDTPNTAWPDSAGMEYTFQGYHLDESGHPTFRYHVGNVQVEDHLTPGGNGEQLIRDIRLDGAAETAWVRVITAGSISSLTDGTYDIDGRTLYLDLLGSQSRKPIIRDGAHGQELLVPVTLQDGPVTVRYALIW